MAAAENRRARYLTIIDYVAESLPRKNFRGCGFFNMTAEIPDRSNPVVRVSQAYVDEVRSLIREAVEDLRNSGIPYADIDVPSVSNAYYVLLWRSSAGRFASMLSNFAQGRVLSRRRREARR